VEFTRRFAQHILPHRFVRIRHYGILSSSWKRGKLQALQHSLKVLPVQRSVKTMLRKWYPPDELHIFRRPYGI
jgi:hypothetical protein